MSKSNRDDFSEPTKINAAKRTGYRCSICSISTIGPSSKSNSSTTSIGEAAHICAAAPGGARYDANMSVEERVSIDNCIWLCKLHARIIDRDVVKYSVSKLKEYKQKAEKYAEEAISEVDLFRNQYNSLCDDITSLENNFIQMLNSGGYDLLRNILENYTYTISSVYDEFVLRFKLIYDMYCNHNMLDEHIKEYIELPNKTGVDNLLEIAIPLNLFNVVREFLPFAINEDIKKISQLLVEGKLEDLLIGSENPYESVEISKEKHELINKYIVHRAVGRNIFRLQTIEGDNVELTSKESYYKLLFAAHRLTGRILYNNASIKNNPQDSDFWELKKNINVIVQLDASLQEFLWVTLLQFALDDKVSFLELSEELPLHMCETFKICKIHWLYKIIHEASAIDINELLSFSELNNYYPLLSRYLWLSDEEYRYEFIKERLYLCKKSSQFLRIICEYDEKHNTSTIQLSKYESIFINDLLYICLRYKYSKDEQIKKESIDWLLEHKNLVTIEDLHLYLIILSSENKWDDIVELSTFCIHNEALFYIANLLGKSGINTYNKKAIQIYEDLEQKGWLCEDLYFNIAVISAKTGKTEKAKKYLKKEYDYYKSQTALYHLLQLRIETNDVKDDEYLYSAKNILTRDFQNIVAASYEKLMNRREARLYVLRTLLIDNGARCIGALFSLNIDEDEKNIEYIQADCIVVLESSSESLNIAIHSKEVLDGLSPNNFADCYHYAVGDKEISPLMYHGIGDMVEFNGTSYKIIDIKSSPTYFASYALRQIISKNDGIKTIRANNSEEAILNITACLKESKSQNDSILEGYNSSEIRYPISILSSIFGKSCIETCEFIAFANSEKIRNNQKVLKLNDEQTYILALDSVVNLTILDFDDKLPKDIKVLCPKQVVNCLLSEVSRMVDELNSKNTKGIIHLVDDMARFAERTTEIRRDRYMVLTSIKAFVGSFPDVEAFDFDCSHGDLESLLVNRKMDVELGTLALLQKYPNAVLVTDDQFLYSVADMIGYQTTGLCGFLASICEDSLQLINISKKLKTINFINYIPLFLFDKIVDGIIKMEAQEDCDIASEELTKWLLSDRGDEEATDHHREVVLQLFRDCIDQIGAPLSSDYPLTKIAIHHFASLHPEYVKELLQELSNNIINQMECDDNNDLDDARNVSG